MYVLWVCMHMYEDLINKIHIIHYILSVYVYLIHIKSPYVCGDLLDCQKALVQIFQLWLNETDEINDLSTESSRIQ